MFESIVLNRSIDGPPLTAGEIAEALIFYQNVHIIMDTSTLLGLIRAIGHHNVIKLLSLPDVKTTFIEEFIGVYAQDSNSGKEYALLSAYISGNNDSEQLKNWKKRLAHMVSRYGYSKAESESFVERFRQHVTLKKLSNDHFIKGGIISAAREDFNDDNYVSSAARIIVENLLHGEKVPDDTFYKVYNSRETFRVSTNIDFDKINRLNINSNHKIGESTPASIAAGIFSASYGLILAAHYGGDFHTSTTDSKIIQHKNKQILARTNANRDELKIFHEIVLNGSPNISAVINQKERSFEEFLELLSKAKRFKKWLKGKSPDKNLVSDYLNDITTTGWLGSGNGKIFRYITSTTLGLAGPITGMVASAVDAFFIDRLSAGWKPNQFITGKMKSFVDVNDEH